MKIVAPEPFTYRGGDKAVLLLHGFTGSPIHMRKLGRYLQQQGFTCHAPLYKGHGVDPLALMQTEPEDWWQDVLAGYRFLKAEGFDKIAVAGVSLGAVFSLKLAITLPVKGVVSMSALVFKKSVDDFFGRVLAYAKKYKSLEGKVDRQTRDEIEELKRSPMHSLQQLQQIVDEVHEKLDEISKPILVIQGLLDEEIYKKSAQLIYDDVSSEEKRLKWYEQSGHIITLGEERDQVYEDINEFLQSLDW